MEVIAKTVKLSSKSDFFFIPGLDSFSLIFYNFKNYYFKADNCCLKHLYIICAQRFLGNDSLVCRGAEEVVSSVHHRHRQSTSWRAWKIENDHSQEWLRHRQVCSSELHKYELVKISFSLLFLGSENTKYSAVSFNLLFYLDIVSHNRCPGKDI